MMTLGAFFAWIWLPDVQDGVDLDDVDADESETGSSRGRPRVQAMTWYKLKTKKLEVLARGRKWAVGLDGEGEGQVLGFKEKMSIPFSDWFRKSGRK